MTEISYKRNHWEKGNVLTAEKLNATEVALENVITKINGVITENNNTVPISDAEHLASIYRRRSGEMAPPVQERNP